MKAKPALPERVRSMEGLGVAASKVCIDQLCLHAGELTDEPWKRTDFAIELNVSVECDLIVLEVLQ